MHVKDSVLVIKPKLARLDATSAHDFKRIMDQALAGGQNKVVLDLSQVSFMDSSGITSLVTFFKNVTCKPGGDLVLCGLKEQLSNLMHITKLDLAIRAYCSQDEATAALGG